MDLNEILEGMSNDNCGNSGYCNTQDVEILLIIVDNL
ncbi:Uncharacterised protein [Clostridium perfringens]|nr:Uncharacterised protein [Clostridium perfringens]